MYGWKGWESRYILFLAFPVFGILLMSSKICNNTSKKGLSHYFPKKRKNVDFKQMKNLKVIVV